MPGAKQSTTAQPPTGFSLALHQALLQSLQPSQGQAAFQARMDYNYSWAPTPGTPSSRQGTQEFCVIPVLVLVA